jgi:hypothetical protein
MSPGDQREHISSYRTDQIMLQHNILENDLLRLQVEVQISCLTVPRTSETAVVINDVSCNHVCFTHPHYQTFWKEQCLIAKCSVNFFIKNVE